MPAKYTTANHPANDVCSYSGCGVSLKTPITQLPANVVSMAVDKESLCVSWRDGDVPVTGQCPSWKQDGEPTAYVHVAPTCEAHSFSTFKAQDTSPILAFSKEM